jgi:hypothetical protein
MRLRARFEIAEICSPLRASDCSVTRCNTQITKTFELRFHAVLGDGASEVCFERATG